MGKSSASFYVEDEYLDRMDEQNINKSNLVNDLLGQYFNGESQVTNAVRDMRKQQVKAERDALETQLELKENELEMLDEQQSKEAQEYHNDVQELINTVQQGGRIWEEHALVKEVAAEHGKSPTEVIETVQEECPNARVDQFTQP